MTAMTADEMKINAAIMNVCGCAWEDAPDFETMAERLEWIRANCMGLGADGEIDSDELDSLIADAKAANV